MVGIPIWEKMTLTVEEASEYSNIGVNKLRDMIKRPDTDFVVYNGTRILIKRKAFENYISQAEEI